jgi:hypothetical protein
MAGDKEIEEDLELLLDAGIPIIPNQQQTESEQNELLNRVLRVFIQLDLENTLKSQQTVRDYLLADTSCEAISEILKDPDVKLGNAFVNVIVASKTLSDIMVNSNSRLAHLHVHQRVCMLTCVNSCLLADSGIACALTSVCASIKFCVFELTKSVSFVAEPEVQNWQRYLCSTWYLISVASRLLQESKYPFLTYFVQKSFVFRVCPGVDHVVQERRCESYEVYFFLSFSMFL